MEESLDESTLEYFVLKKKRTIKFRTKILEVKVIYSLLLSLRYGSRTI